MILSLTKDNLSVFARTHRTTSFTTQTAAARDAARNVRAVGVSCAVVLATVALSTTAFANGAVRAFGTDATQTIATLHTLALRTVAAAAPTSSSSLFAQGPRLSNSGARKSARLAPPPAAAALAFATSSPPSARYSALGATNSLAVAGMALGNTVSTATQSSIQAYTNGIYAFVNGTPLIAQVATNGVLALGNTVARAVGAAVTSIPRAYVDGIYAIANVAPHVAAAGFSVEQQIGNGLFALSQQTENAPFALVQGAGQSLANVVAAIGALPTQVASTLPAQTSGSAQPVQTVADVSGAFPANAPAATSTTATSTAITNTASPVAYQQTASTQNTSFLTPPLPPQPSYPKQTIIEKPINYITNTTVNGLSADQVNAALASLRTNVLNDVQQMIQPIQHQQIVTTASVQQVSMVQNLSDVTVNGSTIDKSTITGSSITGASNISGTTGTFKNLTVSSGAASFGGNTLNVLANGSVGIGTSSPSATLAVNGPIYLAATTTPVATASRLYNYNGSLYWNGLAVGAGGGGGSGTVATGTAGAFAYYPSNGVTVGPASGITWNGTKGFLGIGTTTPWRTLSVAGTSDLGTNALAGSFTATSTTATSTFAGGMAQVGPAGVNISGSKAYYIGRSSVLAYGSGFSVGGSNIASGFGSTAFGMGNTASATYSSAFGYQNTASGFGSTAFGIGNTASATHSSAFGYQNTASGFGSTAFGIGNTASATYSSAFGYQNTASANSASAFGSGITNSIANSTMVGPSNTAKLTILSTGNVEAPFFTATSTTASTFNGGITINGGGLTIPVLAGNLSVGGTSGLTFNNSTHRLGIGTTSPAYPIEVAGSGSIGGAAGLVQTYVYNGAPHSIGTYVGAVPGSGYPIGGWLNTITNDPLYFGTNYTGIPQATLTTTGRFGIGTTSPETTFSVVGAACISKGAGATAACSNTPGTVTADLYTTSLADLAERYQTYDPTLSAGDVIALDPAHTLAVEKATSAAASFIGVVSSAPGVVLGGVNASSASTTVPVALAGRVPVKFSTQNGAIAIGDRLTVSSTTPGIAVKLVGSGSYFGQALEPSSAAQGNTLMAFINPGTYYAGLSIDGAQTNTASASTAVNTSTNGFGLLLAAHATIGTATAPSGITLYDTVTKKPYCFSIANGAPVTTPGTCQTTSPQTTSPQPSPSAATPLAITVNGSNPTYVPVGATYTDAGATVTGGADNGHDPYRIYVSGSTTATSSPYINTRIPATYTLTYTVTDSANVTKSAHRQIVVGNANGMATSTTPAPTPSYSATSTSSPSTATSTPSHTATTTQATSTPPAVDTVPPVVSLNGAATMTLHVGDTFTDPGATAKDAVDGNLTAKIVETGKVDTSTAATYTLTYSATDAAGNTGTATRTVVVAPAPSPSAPTATTTPATASTTPSS